METIVVASQKGGAGKTTCTSHLAVAAILSGHGPVAVIDTDPQETLSTWWNLRQVDQPALIKGKVTTLADSLEKAEQAGVRICFIDTPPALGEQTRDVLRLADLIIIPTRPSPADLWALGSTLKLVNDVGKPFVFVITQAKANTRLTLQTMAALSEHGPVASSILGDRVDYASALIDGRTALETARSGIAAQEVMDLWAGLYERISEPAKGRNRAKGVKHG